jgi:hypothetical protein
MFQIQSTPPEIQSSSRYAAAYFNSSLNPPLIAAASSASIAARPCVFLLFEVSGTLTSRLRNFDTELPSSYCYEFQPEHRWKAPLRAHRRRFARPPQFLNRAGLKDCGRRDHLRNTAWPFSRNGNDSAGMTTKSTWHELNQGNAFLVERQGSENARRFEMSNCCHVSKHCLNYFHKLFTFGRGAEAFSNS